MMARVAQFFGSELGALSPTQQRYVDALKARGVEFDEANWWNAITFWIGPGWWEASSADVNIQKILDRTSPVMAFLPEPQDVREAQRILGMMDLDGLFGRFVWANFKSRFDRDNPPAGTWMKYPWSTLLSTLRNGRIAIPGSFQLPPLEPAVRQMTFTTKPDADAAQRLVTSTGKTMTLRTGTETGVQFSPSAPPKQVAVGPEPRPDVTAATTGLSRNAKIALLVGGVAVVGLGAYLLLRKKGKGSKQATAFAGTGTLPVDRRLLGPVEVRRIIAGQEVYL